MATETPAPVGYFHYKGKVVQIVPKRGESVSQAINRVTSRYGVSPSEVKKGIPTKD